MSKPDSPDSSQINISRIKVAGIGGLGMVAIVAVIALALPEVRWFAMITLLGGAVAGALYIAYRRRQGPLNWDKTWNDKPESKFHHLSRRRPHGRGRRLLYMKRPRSHHQGGTGVL